MVWRASRRVVKVGKCSKALNDSLVQGSSTRTEELSSFVEPRSVMLENFSSTTSFASSVLWTSFVRKSPFVAAQAKLLSAICLS